jgi:hypothetical protein
MCLVAAGAAVDDVHGGQEGDLASRRSPELFLAPRNGQRLAENFLATDSYLVGPDHDAVRVPASDHFRLEAGEARRHMLRWFTVEPTFLGPGCVTVELHLQSRKQHTAVGRGRGQDEPGRSLCSHGRLHRARGSLKNKGLSSNSF